MTHYIPYNAIFSNNPVLFSCLQHCLVSLVTNPSGVDLMKAWDLAFLLHEKKSGNNIDHTFSLFSVATGYELLSSNASSI